MLVNDKAALRRLNSSDNLINRLRDSKKNNAMSLFGLRPDGTRVAKRVDFNPFSKPVEAPAKQETQVQKVETPSELPVLPQEADLDTILVNPQSQIKLKLAHDKALDLLTNSVAMLSDKLAEVSASKLPSVIAAASKTVESIRRERAEATKNNRGGDVHYHFYTPEQKKITDYEVIDIPA